MSRLDYLKGKLKSVDEKYEYKDLDTYRFNYDSIKSDVLKETFIKFQTLFFWHFNNINNGLENHYYWADVSREMISIIKDYKIIKNALVKTKYNFQMKKYYEDIVIRCESFLKSSGGTEIPSDFEKIQLVEFEPMFSLLNSDVIKNDNKLYNLKMIGEGSYATVYKYKDSNYNKLFAVKRAKSNLTPKEIQRFKREYSEMKSLNSPYILEVYKFDDEKLEYTMEYIRYTLKEYIEKNNSNKLTFGKRVSIIKQILRGFKYMHNQSILHRDVSRTNILIKEYNDVEIIKISDFGLVKVKNSDLTSINTEFKGSLNDPKLNFYKDGFKDYGIVHETFALTRLIYFVITGRKQFQFKKDPDNLVKFIEKGVNDDLEERYQSIDELKQHFDNYRKFMDN